MAWNWGRAIPSPEPAVPAHPSAPIPVQGPGIGSALRAPLGETGIEVFPLMLGGGEFGWTVDQRASEAVLDRYAAHGGNALHTSDRFGGGRSEHVIGSWMRSRGVRDDMVLAVRVGGHPDHPGLGSVDLVRAVESSLERIGTDRIDVLYLDATGYDAPPIEDALATAQWLVESGKVRALGVFGFSPEQLVEARILASAGYPRIEAIDVAFNLLRPRVLEGDLRLVVSAQGIAVTPSHPLEHGFLSGKHRSRSDAAKSVRGAQLAERINRRGGRLLKAMDEISAELGAPHAAIAIAWLRAQRGVVAPIANAFDPSHVDELVQGVGLALSRAHIAELARAAA
jgi:aryl-alcohol dehydrogenase-like predicted oxidoreductase